jgi:tetratricopeptide (TPR) repeat protein
MQKMFNFIIKTNIYLLVFLLPLFFLPFSFEAFEFNKQYLLFFLVSLTFFAWLAKMVLIDKEIRFKRTPLDVPILAFLFIAILGTFFSVDKTSSLFGFYGKFSDGLIGLLSLVITYFLITNNLGVEAKVPSQKAKKEEVSHQLSGASISGVVNTFLWSVFFVILFSYFSIFGLLKNFKMLPAVITRQTFNPIAGSLEGLAIFLAVVTVFLTSLLMTDWKAKNSQSKKFIISPLLILSLALLILIDFNRAWILLLITLLLCVAIALGKRMFKEDVNKLLLPMLLIIASAAFLFIDSSGLQSLIFKTRFPQEQVLNQKYSLIVAFKAATENIKSGLVGSGLGTFYYDFAKFKPKDFNQSILWQIRFDRPGNYLAEVLGTTGFLGILSYLFLIVIFLVISYLFLQQNRDSLPLIMTFLALLIGQFVYYQNTTLSFCFWLFMALAVVSWQKPIKEKTVSFKSFPELALIFSILLIALGLGILVIYFFAGRFYWADVNYKNAINITGGENKTEKLEKAAGLNPYQPAYKIVLARSYLAKLITETQKPADQRNQDLWSIYVFQAVNYTKGGQIGNTRIKGATELAPNQVAGWETLGAIYRDIQGLAGGASEWAIKAFEKAVALEPTNPVLHTELGKIYAAADNIDKAREEFEKAKELKPDYADALIQVALIYERQNNLAEAIKQMENLIKSYPSSPEILLQLGRLYFNNNRTNDAISQFRTAINLAPDYSNAHYSLGVAFQKLGYTNEAIAEFEKVLTLNPGNADVQEKLNQLKTPTK